MITTMVELNMLLSIMLLISSGVLLSLFKKRFQREKPQWWKEVSPSLKFRKTSFFAWRTPVSFDPTLPDVPAYSVQSQTFRPSIFASEFPVPLQTPSHSLEENALPYVLKEQLLDEAEQNLFRALEKILSKDYRLFTKVRLASILDTHPDLETRYRQTKRERLRQKQVDFVLCERKNFRVIGVIALDKDIDQNFETQVHDKFVEMALDTARIPVLHLPIKRVYPLNTLRKLIDQTFGIKLPILHKRQSCSVRESDKINLSSFS